MSNVDQAEVNKFNELSGRWWDKNGPVKTLHDINPLRLDFIKSRTKLFNAKTIDIGCGGGILSEALAKTGAIVTGLDKADDLIKIAKMHKYETDLDIDYICCDVEDFSAENSGQFDVIVCMELLEHVPNPKELLSCIVKLAQPGADIFLSTLNRNFKSYLMAILGAEYLLKLLPKGTHDYMKFIKPSEICNWAREYDLILEDMKGLHLNPLSKQYSLNKDISVNYLIHFKRANNDENHTI